MYLWIGLGMDVREEESIRAYCKRVNGAQVSEAAFTLPQHVSLKTSFETERWQEIVACVKNRYGSLEKITVEAEGVWQIPGIIWLRIKENVLLRKLHSDLNGELTEKFGVPMRGYDGERFAFHSTLFQDMENPQGILSLYEKMDKEGFYSREIVLDRLHLGTSLLGKAGTYRVVDFAELK